MRVLLTRPASDSAELARVLEGRGYRCRIAPLFIVAECGWDPALLDGVHAVLLTSRNAARQLARAWTLSRDVKVFAVGPATAAEAGAFGFRNVTAAAGTAESLLDLVRRSLAPNAGRIAYMSGAVVSVDIAADLRRDGFAVEQLVVYHTIPVKRLSPLSMAEIRLGNMDVGLFLSRRTAQVFRDLMCEAALDPYCASMSAIAISAKVAQELQDLPWRSLEYTDEPSLNSVLAALNRMKGDRRCAEERAGRHVLAGSDLGGR
ncbi:uroporphyrinogen-III synthase [Azospirillum sp.]|uniref:uroporphyrinogen-III synthase n=1 Tax=Azospirillum sp. TaxID=34012 RepID=UPI003D708BED